MELPPPRPHAGWPPPAPVRPPAPAPPLSVVGTATPKRSGWTPWRALVASLVAVALVGGAVGATWSVGRDHRSAPAVTVAASSTPARSTAPTSAEPRPPGATWDPRLEPLARFVEEARGRPFKRSVPVRFLDDAAFLDELDLDSEPLSEEDADYFASVDRALGWIGAGLDSEAAWTALMADGVVAFYEPGRRRIVMRGVPDDGALPVDVRVILVHELTHAWQDQNLGLDALVEDAEGDLAWTAVVEGDAMHVESQYVATLSAAEQAAWAEVEQARHDDHAVDRGGAVMYEVSLTAPYLLGERLVGALDASGDDAGVDSAFAEPPSSSEQAMFAALVAGDVGPVDVTATVEPEGATWMDERPLGAWDVFTTLVTRLDGRTAVEAARAWAGGWETVYEAEAGGICVGWRLAADDAAGYESLRAALRSWSVAGPAGVAAVTADPALRLVELQACDPGARAVGPDPIAVFDALAWLLAHEDVVAELAHDVPIAAADCAATRLLDSLEPSAISFDGLDRTRTGLVEAAGAFQDACRGVPGSDG